MLPDGFFLIFANKNGIKNHLNYKNRKKYENIGAKFYYVNLKKFIKTLKLL
jgi:hypothetical protein